MRGLGLGRGLRRRRTPAVAPQPELIYDRANLASGWTGVNATIGVSSENDPESGQVASDVLETTADNAHYVAANIAFTQGESYRLRLVIRGVSRVNFTLQVVDAPNRYWYGTLGSTTPLLSSGMSNPTVTDLGGGWYAHAIEWDLTGVTGSKSVRIGISLDPLDTTYPGDVAKGIRVGSVKIYRMP